MKDCFDCENISSKCKTCKRHSNWSGDAKNDCILCGAQYDPDDNATIIGSARDMLSDGLRFGVCPTCRRHAEIGRRVEGMKPAKYPEGEGADMRYEEIDQADGYNRCLREAKGEKP